MENIELNRIYQMDCLEGMKLIPDKSIDMILCDLPYGSSGCKWDNVIPLEPLWEQYKRIIKSDGAIALFGTDQFASILINSNLEMYRYKWIWNKLQSGSFQLAKLKPMIITEEILIFSKAKTANGAKLNMRYYPIKEKRDKPAKAGGKPSTTDLLHSNNMVALHNVYKDKYPINILTFKKPTGKNRVHPTQKPEALFEYLIKTYTKEGETVLDNCMGSGTTAVACEINKRKWIGFEILPEYLEIANKRLEQSQIEK